MQNEQIKWIKVEEGRPDDEKQVILCVSDSLYFGYCVGDQWYLDNDCRIDGVLYWAEIYGPSEEQP